MLRAALFTSRVEAAGWTSAGVAPVASTVLLPTLASPSVTQSNNMATLKDLSLRLKGVKNMRKITKAMKMVAASKLRIAERAMGPAVAYGDSANRLTQKMDGDLAPVHKEAKTHLIVTITSDKGLCGGVNSSIIKQTKGMVARNLEAGIETKIVTVGEKARAGLNRAYGKYFLHSFGDFGRNAFNYMQASYIADKILSSEFKYQKLTLVSNKYKSIIAYEPIKRDMLSPEDMASRRTSQLTPYELEGDPDIINNYQAQYLANMLLRAVVENTAVEQASRMQAMDNASSNASDMIGRLTQQFNRTRQAVITRELIEIISGASAL